jgi:hypothetical protein
MGGLNELFKPTEYRPKLTDFQRAVEKYNEVMESF